MGGDDETDSRTIRWGTGVKGRMVAFGVVAVLLVAGVVGGVSLGYRPWSSHAVDAGLSGSSQDSGSNSGGIASSGGSGGQQTGGAKNVADSAENPAFLFQVDQIKSCGRTCRDVTATVTNQQNSTATNVKIVTQIYTKQDKLWEGSQTFDHIDSSASKTRTERVKLGYLDAIKVKQNGGYVTVKTTVTWNGGQQTFSQRRKVA